MISLIRLKNEWSIFFTLDSEFGLFFGRIEETFSISAFYKVLKSDFQSKLSISNMNRIYRFFSIKNKSLEAHFC